MEVMAMTIRFKLTFFNAETRLTVMKFFKTKDEAVNAVNTLMKNKQLQDFSITPVVLK